MYAKCSKINECEQIFDDIKSEENDKYRNDILIWNTMICAYGWNGDLFKVKHIYDLLMEIGVIPNIKTYVSLITACSDCGDIVFVQKIWNNEIDDTIKYDEDIMSALIDAMTRKGYLKTAMQLLLKHDSNCCALYISLLNGCKTHRNGELAEKVYYEIINRFGEDGRVRLQTKSKVSNKIYHINRPPVLFHKHESEC
eukprot:UN03059